MASRAKSSAFMASASACDRSPYAATQSRRSYASRARTSSSTTPITHHFLLGEYALQAGRSGGLQIRLPARTLDDAARHELGVAADSGEDHRAERELERQSAEVQARRRVNDTAILLGPPVLADDRHVDPVEDLPEPGAPDDVRD